MGLISSYVLYMLEDVVAAIPAVIILRLLAAVSRRKKGRATTLLHEAGAVLFLLFFCSLLAQTISPRYGFDIHNIRLQGGLNLEPFRAIRQILYSESDYIWLNILGNIAMFVPMGLCVPLLWKPMAAFWKIVPLGCLLSVFIESCQLFLLRGTDVDDVILNTAGALLGYCGFALLRWLAPRFVRRCRCVRLGARR